jgi:tRNA threonylcarbamoyladenosine biosynthesis protein TsaE
MSAITTHSREETQNVAAEAAARISALPHTRAAVVTLRGELGAGKTTFTQGFLAALGVEDRVTSPTFVLMQRYPLSGVFTDAYHLDAYRLMQQEDFSALDLDGPLADPRALFLIEWPEVGGELFRSTLDVQLEHGTHDDERRITLTWHTS